VIRAAAAAKINLSLAVGGERVDRLHELTSIFQRVDIVDRIAMERAERIVVEGFDDDTLVRAALAAVIEATSATGGFRVTIEKQIPVAAGLGGGSADAGTVLKLANELLGDPLSVEELSTLGFSLGADVPFFVRSGPQLIEGAGELSTPVELPQDYWVLVALPAGIEKPSTGEIFDRFDRASSHDGYEERRADLLDRLPRCLSARDLGSLPGNDLGPHAGGLQLAEELRANGAFRADVSGAGPAVYGLFLQQRHARQALKGLEGARAAWLTVPVW
jgi:4-diphosphocytidyl-2-C-methyl-D-erythritol kinase